MVREGRGWCTLNYEFMQDIIDFDEVVSMQNPKEAIAIHLLPLPSQVIICLNLCKVLQSKNLACVCKQKAATLLTGVLKNI